jgi:hypothetical protein
MNRAPFTLVDSLGTKARRSRLATHHQRKGAADGLGPVWMSVARV